MNSRPLVNVSVDEEGLTITPRGMWKVWSFCRSRQIPFDALTAVRLSSAPLTEFPTGVRVAGLDIVSYLAGYFQNNGKRSWWCYRNGRSATVLQTNFPKLTTFVFSSRNDAELVAQLKDRVTSRVN